MSQLNPVPKISEDELHEKIREEYASVARSPHKGYHFHTGRNAAKCIGYDNSLYTDLPEENIASFAGTGNPFVLGPIKSGEIIVDVGSGSGFDALIAEIVQKHNIFEGVPRPSSALDYGTQGVSLRARKPKGITTGLLSFLTD